MTTDSPFPPQGSYPQYPDYHSASNYQTAYNSRVAAYPYNNSYNQQHTLGATATGAGSLSIGGSARMDSPDDVAAAAVASQQSDVTAFTSALKGGQMIYA